MQVRNQLSELVDQDGFYVEILRALLQPHGVSRLPDFDYFTFFFQGDEVLLTDEYRKAVETALGVPLVEKTNVKPITSLICLSVPPELKDHLCAVVESFDLANPVA